MMRLPLWFIKLGFYLLYNQMAWTYDWIAWSVSFGQWATWRRLALQFFQPGETLELAYGTGGFFVDMIEVGHRPVGIDLSPYMARLTRRRLIDRRYSICLCRAMAQALPFPSGQFANVVATFPTDYMLQGETLAEIYRVLNDSGRLIIVAEGELRGPWPLRPFIDWLYRVTDQRRIPPAKPLALIKKYGFQARWKIAEGKGAIARLLIGDKPPPQQ